MLSLARLVTPVRQGARPLALFPLRTYASDAGPSRDRSGEQRESYKKQQRRHQRESVAAGRTTELKDLSFLDFSAPEKGPRSGSGSGPNSGSRSYGLSGGDASPRLSAFWGPRFGTRRDRDAFYHEKFVREKEANKAGQHQSPFTSSEKVKTWIQRHPSPLSEKQIEEVVKMVEDLHPKSVNAAVWNLIFALLGREKKYQRMWKAFNNMKRRNVQPSSRTYTTLLNAYAGVSHAGVASGQFTPQTRPEKLTLDRVRLIYEQSQRHIANMVRKTSDAGDDETGLSSGSMQWPETQTRSERDNEAEINISPTNSYLKFLGRFGMWEEMERVFVAMDAEGPLAPNAITYTTILKAADAIAAYRKQNPDLPVELADFEIGPTARGYWDQAVRQLCGRDPTAAFDPARGLDEGLALTALTALAVGRPEDQRLVEKLVARLWGLPSPREPGVASSVPARAETLAHTDLPPSYADLPRFKLGLKSATSLMGLLARSPNRTMASHYTHFILENKQLRKEWDLHALRAAVFVFANARDVDAVRAVLDTYQPPTGKDGWPVEVYHAALKAARWSADWEAALAFFRRMTHLPFGAEHADAASQSASLRPYKFSPPNGHATDCRGRPWIDSAPLRPDALAMSTLLKAGVASGLKELRQAVSVFTHYGSSHWWTVRSNPNAFAAGAKKAGTIAQVDLLREPAGDLSASMRRAVADRVELAKDIMDACERLTPMPKDRDALFALKDQARSVVQNYGGVVGGTGAEGARKRGARGAARSGGAHAQDNDGADAWPAIELPERSERPQRTERSQRTERPQRTERRSGPREDRPRGPRREWDGRDRRERPARPRVDDMDF